MKDVHQFILRTNYDSPSNYVDVVNEFDESFKMTNPTCSDVIEIGVNRDGNILEQIVFSGNGCVLSIASASIMTQTLKRSTIETACAKKSEFLKIMDNDMSFSECSFLDCEEIRALSSVNQYSSRIYCVKLSWLTFERCVC